MLYEKLNSTMRQMVDAWAGRLQPLPWQQRSDLLTEAARPFGEQFPGEQGATAARGFITAVLERLDEDDPVRDPFQASMYRLSLDPAHRQAAEHYLDDHPELRELVERELGAPRGDLDPDAEPDA